METVVTVVHLILALILIGVVLIQRSEGGGGLMGGSNAPATGRSGTTPMAKVTWIVAGLFIVTSLALTILAASGSTGSSIMDNAGNLLPPTSSTAPADSLLPPSASTDPLTPTAQ